MLGLNIAFKKYPSDSNPARIGFVEEPKISTKNLDHQKMIEVLQ